MLLKIVYLFITSLLFWMVVTDNFVFSAVVVKPAPYRDSFDVVQSRNFTDTQILETIYNAEQARILHGTNLTKIADYMITKSNYRFGHDNNCFVNIGEISGGFYAVPNYIYLKSDTGDNMYIICFKTLSSPFPSRVLI